MQSSPHFIKQIEMADAVPMEVKPTKKERKTYFPFKYGMRSAEFQGVGAGLAQNCEIENARLRKAKGQSLWEDLITGKLTDSGMSGLAFDATGSNLYVCGSEEEKVYQITLSTPGDITTMAAWQNCDVFSYSTKQLVFNGDGTKMYILGTTLNRIREFTLSTGWDITTATYASSYISASTEDSAPLDFKMSTDGSKMYILGSTNKTIYQYTLSTPWDVSTATYASKSFLVSAAVTTPYVFTFFSSGAKVLVYDKSDGKPTEYTLSTPWDISTAGSAVTSSTLLSDDCRGLWMDTEAVWADASAFYSIDLAAERIYTGTWVGGFVFTTEIEDIFTQTGLAINAILSLGSYEKSDGTIQTLSVCELDDTYRLRAIDADGTAVTPVNDVSFTSSNFDYEQIGTTGFVSNESATTPLYTWNGSMLVAVPNAPASPKFIVRDGNRVGINKVFSGETPGVDFTAGSGATADGDYATSLNPTGAVVAGAGIILFGIAGAEAHKVVPNSASDDVSAKTKSDTFNYTGLGVKNTHQCCAGGNYVYFFNENGIHEMNPYSGETVNLVERGNIQRRWSGYNLSSAFITYDSSNGKIVVCLGSVGQNDTLVVVDVEKKERPITISNAGFLNSAAMIGNQLRGGSSQTGKIFDLFSAYSDENEEPLTYRYVIEWDALTNPILEKRIKRFAIFASLSPFSSFTAKLYINGDHTPIKEEVFTTTAAIGDSGVGTILAPMNKYVFNLGGGRDSASTSENTDKIKRVRKNKKISTFCLEILETSLYPFEVHDILVEYKTKGRIIRDKVMPNTLF